MGLEGVQPQHLSLAVVMRRIVMLQRRLWSGRVTATRR